MFGFKAQGNVFPAFARRELEMEGVTTTRELNTRFPRAPGLLFEPAQAFDSL